MVRSRWAVLAGGVAVGAACAGLGTWQVQRHAEKRAWIAAMSERMAQPPLPLAAALGEPGAAEYRRVVARGQYRLDDTVLLLHQRRGLQSGVRALTPLAVRGGGRDILVDRGFVPAAEADAFLDGQRGAPEVRVEGVLRALPERELASGAVERRTRWHNLQPAALERQLGRELEPWLLVSAGSGADTPPLPTPVEPTSTVNHVYYAIQWYAIAAVALIGATAFAVRATGPGPPTDTRRGAA